MTRKADGKQRWSTVVIVGGAAVILVGVVVGIAISVTSRRHQRDVRFGVEQLDILIQDRRLDEAEAMLPWLAERSATASDGIRIARRAREVAELTGDTGLLASIIERLISQFPGNRSLQELYVYALVRAGRAGEALDFADRRLRDRSDGALYAWTLLSATASGQSVGNVLPALGDAALLAELSTRSSPEQYTQAYEMTGDWRYAADGALLYMEAAEREAAADLALRASLATRMPSMAARLLFDAGRYDLALEAVRRIPRTDRSESTILLEADLSLLTGNRERASELYRELANNGSSAETAYTNLAWLIDDDEQALSVLTAGMERVPDSWRIREQYAIRMARVDLGEAYRVVDELVLSGASPFDERARLLRLKLEPDSVRRGYAAALWTLLETARDEESYRFAAWYFMDEGSDEDLVRILGWTRARVANPGAWLDGYEGIASARAGEWATAEEMFATAFGRDPQWYWALDDTIALLRTLRTGRAKERIDDAILLAGYAVGRQTALPFIIAARLSDDRMAAIRLLDQARERDPDNQEAVLLGYQLDSAAR